MKITEFGTIVPSSAPKKTASVSGAGSFADVLSAAETAGNEPAAPLSDIGAAAALNNLLALQEISEEDIKRQKTVQHGNNMLATLDKLRQQLLSGSLSLPVLKDLQCQVMLQKQSVNDQRLMEVIDEIELRAAVEAAKLEMAMRGEQVME